MIIIPKGCNGRDILVYNRVRIAKIKTIMADVKKTSILCSGLGMYIERGNFKMAKEILSDMFYEEISDAAFEDFIYKISLVKLENFISEFEKFYLNQAVKGFVYNTMTIFIKLNKK